MSSLIQTSSSETFRTSQAATFRERSAPFRQQVSFNRNRIKLIFLLLVCRNVGRVSLFTNHNRKRGSPTYLIERTTRQRQFSNHALIRTLLKSQNEANKASHPCPCAHFLTEQSKGYSAFRGPFLGAPPRREFSENRFIQERKRKPEISFRNSIHVSIWHAVFL